MPAPGYIYSAQSASILILNGPGELVGIFVSSSTAGTLKAWDNIAGSGTVIFATTGAITAPVWLPCPAHFGRAAGGGLFITVGGTISYTVIYRLT